MADTDIEKRIKDLLTPILEEKSLFLVDLELKGYKGSRTLSVYVDAENSGVDIDECVEISRELGFLLDSNDVIEGKYRLNVSSPGLDRPLKDLRQYAKNKGRKARVRIRDTEQPGKEVSINGTLKAYDGKKLIIETKQGKDITIEAGDVIETKILAAW